MVEKLSPNEILRVYSNEYGGQGFTIQTTWEDPGAWGILLVDLARHTAQAYAEKGYSKEAALNRIREGFDAEWSAPTE